MKCKIFRPWLKTQTDYPDFSPKLQHFLFKQVLSYHFALLLRLGGYRLSPPSYSDKPAQHHMDLLFPKFSSSQSTGSRLNDGWVFLWPGGINFHDPANSTLITRQAQCPQAGNYFIDMWKTGSTLEEFFPNILLRRSTRSWINDGWVFISSIFLQGTRISKLIVKPAHWYDKETQIFQKPGSLNKAVFWASRFSLKHINYSYFQELTMNKFKLTWGLMLGIWPHGITRPTGSGHDNGGLMMTLKVGRELKTRHTKQLTKKTVWRPSSWRRRLKTQEVKSHHEYPCLTGKES